MRIALINASHKLKKVIYIGHRLKPISVLFLNLSHSWYIYFSSSTIHSLVKVIGLN